jgi:hypothetical protein
MQVKEDKDATNNTFRPKINKSKGPVPNSARPSSQNRHDAFLGDQLLRGKHKSDVNGYPGSAFASTSNYSKMNHTKNIKVEDRLLAGGEMLEAK